MGVIQNNKRGGKREGAGRPSLYEGEKRAINLKLITEAIEILTRESEKTKISRSDIVNKLIIEHLK